MQRGLLGTLESDHRAVAVGGEQRREHDRHRGENRGNRGASGKRQHGSPDAGEPRRTVQPPACDIDGKQIKSQHGDLVAPDGEEPDRDAGRNTGSP